MSSTLQEQFNELSIKFNELSKKFNQRNDEIDYEIGMMYLNGSFIKLKKNNVSAKVKYWRKGWRY